MSERAIIGYVIKDHVSKTTEAKIYKSRPTKAVNRRNHAYGSTRYTPCAVFSDLSIAMC